VHQLDAGAFNDRFSHRLWLGEATSLIVLSLGVAAAAVRSRRARAVVANMVVELAEAPAPGRLRESLARRLGDPGLEIIYPIGDRDAVDRAAGTATTALVRDGQTVAVVVHRNDLLGDRHVVEDVVAAAAVAFDNERLVADAQARLVELRTSQARLVAASDRERQQLERDLHDGAQQRLVGLGLAMRLSGARRGPAAVQIEAAEVELAGAVADLRELASSLHPAVLTDLGLAAALRALAERATIPLRILDLPVERLPDATERTAYHLVAEALRTGAVTAAITRCADGLVVDVDIATVPDRLDNIADRVGAVDGRLATAFLPTGGVHIRAVIPCG
jgi:signal transduction histidine kinase